MSTRIVAALILALTLAAAGWRIYTRGQQSVQREWDAERRQAELQAEQRREINRTTARQAETLVAAQAVYRDRYITQTITEIRHVTDLLAACPVPPAAVRMLNDAAACARGDRPASCAAGQPVPGPG